MTHDYIHDYDKAYFERFTKESSQSHGVAFAADCCERMIDSYAFFSEHAKWGNAARLREFLDAVWDNCISVNTTEAELKEMLESCVSLVPDSKDFQDYFAEAAQDACSAVHSSIFFLLEGNAQGLLCVVNAALGPVDTWADVQEGDFDEEGKWISKGGLVNVHAPDYWDTLRRKPTIQRELHRQQECLDMLRAIGDLDEKTVGLLRKRSRGVCSITEAIEYSRAAMKGGAT